MSGLSQGEREKSKPPDPTAPVRCGRRTKDLARRLRSGEIAVIAHRDLDELGARSLIEAGAVAVLNAEKAISGRYPNRGPELLLQAAVPLIDCLGDPIFTLENGEIAAVDGATVTAAGGRGWRGRRLTPERVRSELVKARHSFAREMEHFLDNTLRHLEQEKETWLVPFPLPPVAVQMRDRHVLIVVRGHRYREDLTVIRRYIDDTGPVLIGVDGGADAIVDLGLRPDVVIGDMDSVSDRGLRLAREVVVHAYPDGEAPGMARIRDLGIEAVKLPAPGTSEDVAMMVAYQAGAELIVAVGTHSNAIDFLEKGREGMASTLLTRMQVGSRLVDARGVARLYQTQPNRRLLLWLVAGALAPVFILLSLSPAAVNLFYLLRLQLRLVLGGGG